MAFIACLMTAFFALHSTAIVRTFLATMLRSGIFNLRRVVLSWYCSCLIDAKSSPFKVLLLLHKVVRFRNFLCTLLPCNHAGANTSTETGCFKTQILVNQKKEFLVSGTRNLAFAGATFSPTLVFFFSFLFLFFSRPLLEATDHLPWSFSFLFFSFLSHIPLLWRQTSPGGLNGFRLVFILAGALFYGTVSFRKFTSV
jgi:hypothetical protein